MKAKCVRSVPSSFGPGNPDTLFVLPVLFPLMESRSNESLSQNQHETTGFANEHCYSAAICLVDKDFEHVRSFFGDGLARPFIVFLESAFCSGR